MIAIHQFLCVMAIQRKMLPGDIDPKDSATEVWKIAHDTVAMMAMRGDTLVGTMGLINPGFWWNNKVKFLANRWLFALPGTGACAALVREANAIAKGSGYELYVIDEAKGRLKIFNKLRA